jgi:hypothetical protein
MKTPNNSAFYKQCYFFKEICISSIIFRVDENSILLKGLFQFDELHFQSYLAVDYKLLNELTRNSPQKKLANDLNSLIAEFLSTETFVSHIIEINLKDTFNDFFKLNELYLFAASKKIPIENICNVSNYLLVEQVRQANQ